MSTSFFCLCHLRSSSAKMHMMWAGTVTLFSTESCLAGGGGLLLLTCVSSGAPAVGQTQEHNVQTQKSRVGWLKKTCRFLHSLSDFCLFVVLSPLPTPAWICQPSSTKCLQNKKRCPPSPPRPQVSSINNHPSSIFPFLPRHGEPSPATSLNWLPLPLVGSQDGDCCPSPTAAVVHTQSAPDYFCILHSFRRDCIAKQATLSLSLPW